jgi:hypothetical protein
MGRNACSADPSAPPSTRFHHPEPTVDGTGRPDADAAMSEKVRGPTGLIRRAADVAWDALTTDEVANRLEVDPAKGLIAAEAQRRLVTHGPNAMAEAKAATTGEPR